ncbi:hypothetical protein AVEN_116418-1 [Araneus ventricosus]|uniref:Uncharacterized protein n=1 Tax=Araneus ventricosus TaxID=182803 RepID=A0A4Y2UA58_ARAVE|nr:hypothetical protein AVEN_116418-1 [Araneus ventricosus]
MRCERFQSDEQKKIFYPNIPSARHPVLHGTDILVRSLQIYWKILLHIKLGRIKQFVKALPKEGKVRNTFVNSSELFGIKIERRDFCRSLSQKTEEE